MIAPRHVGVDDIDLYIVLYAAYAAFEWGQVKKYANAKDRAIWDFLSSTGGGDIPLRDRADLPV